MFEDDQVELLSSDVPNKKRRMRAKMKTEVYTVQNPGDSTSTIQSSELGSTSTTTTLIKVTPTRPTIMSEGNRRQPGPQINTECVGDLIKAIQVLDHTMSNYVRVIKKNEAAVKTERIESAGEKINKKETDEVIRIDQVNVYVRIVYLKIGEIDTVKENFAADIFLQTKWREPALDHKALNADDIDWDMFWDPKIHVDNILGDSKQSVWRTICVDEAGRVTVQEKRRIKAVFVERMELKQFPFDTQELSVHVVSERPDTEVSLDEDENEVSSINVQSFVDEQEWKLHSHVEVRKEKHKPQFRNVKYHIPGMTFCCRAFRRGGFFIYNIILVMFCIMGLAFATFSVAEDLPQNRLQLSFTLVLTTITFKFVVNQSLPKISYLTYLDKYILISMAILCLVCVWHAIVMIIHTHYGRDTAEFADMIAIIILGGGFILFQIIYIGLVSGFSLRRRWHNMKLDQEFQEKFDRALGIFSVEKTDLNNTRVGPA